MGKSALHRCKNAGGGSKIKAMNIVFEALKVAARGLVLDEVPADVQEIRYQTCLSCDKRKPETDQCGICNCFLQLKSGAKTNLNPLKGRTEITHCPIGKWGDIEIANYYRGIDGKPAIPQI